MTLIQFLYAPGRVFADLKENSWALPLIAFVLLFLLSPVLVWHATGTNEIIRRGLETIPEASGRDISASYLRPRLGFAVIFTAGMNVLNLLIIAWVIRWALRLVHEMASYGIVLAVWSFAAYARELVGLLITTAVLIFHQLANKPLPDARAIRTDATVFLKGAAIGGRLRTLAESLDLQLIGFVLLAVFGLSKAIPMRFSKAALVTLIPWALYIVVMVLLPRRG